VGLQFLALDRHSTDQIESFVHERVDEAPQPAPPGGSNAL
jgi:hypothetical protein